MASIRYDDLSRALIERVPELQARYDAELRAWGDETPGPHIVFGDVLYPALAAALRSNEREELIKRSFAFLEELANDSDDQIQNVVAVSVCEQFALGGDEWLLAKAREYMGESTLRFTREIEDWRPNQRPS